MEKIKAILNPGAKADDEILYDTGESNNLGKQTGEGTHFGHSRTTHGDPATEDVSSGSAAQPQTTAPGITNEPTATTTQEGLRDDRAGGTLENKTTRETAYEPTSKTVEQPSSGAERSIQKEPISEKTTGAGLTQSYSDNSTVSQGQGNDYAPSSSNPYSAQPVDSRLNPNQPSEGQDQAARNLALGGAAAGAAGTGYTAEKRHDEDVTSAPGRVSYPQSITTEPGMPAGGVSSTAYPDTQIPGSYPETSTTEQSVPAGGVTSTTYPDTQTTGSYPQTSAAERGVSAGGVASTTFPDTQTPQSVVVQDNSKARSLPFMSKDTNKLLSSQTATGESDDQLNGRDAAIGAGVVGAGAATTTSSYEPSNNDTFTPHPYLSERQHEPTTTTSQSQAATYPTAVQTQAPSSSSTYYQDKPTATSAAPTEKKADDQHHYGRDAALGAGAVGAAGIAAHEYSQRDAEKGKREYEAQQAEQQKVAAKEAEQRQKEAEKEAKREQKAHEKEVKEEQKEHDKEVKKEQKEHDKEVKKEQKEHDKEVKKEQKEHDKEVKKEQKEHNKEVKKEQKAAEKEAKKEQKEHERELKKEQKQHEKELEREEQLAAEKEREDERARQATILATQEREREKEQERTRVAEEQRVPDEELARPGDVEGEEGEKKKGGLFGIFSRNKKHSSENPEDHDSRNKAAAGTTAGAAVGGGALAAGHEYDKREADTMQPQSTQGTVQPESTQRAVQPESTQRTAVPSQKYEDTQAEEPEKKKSHGVLGFLHRDKKDKETIEEDDSNKGAAVAGAGAIGAAGVAGYEYNKSGDQTPTASGAYDSTTAPAPVQGYSRADDSMVARQEPTPVTGGYGSTTDKGYSGAGKSTATQQEQTPVVEGFGNMDTSDRGYGKAAEPTTAKEEHPAEDHEKKKHGLAGLLHRDKKEKDESKPKSAEEEYHKKEAAAATIGGAAVTKHEHDKHDEPSEEPEKKKSHGLMGLLHRDKKDKSEMDTADEESGRHKHSIIGGFSGKEGGAPGAQGVPPDQQQPVDPIHHNERNRLHKDPPPGKGYATPPKEGYASQVTGGTGTTASTQGDKIPDESHLSDAGSKLDPNVASRGSTVTDPTTGLPMDLNKGEHSGYGTDGIPHESHGHGTGSR